MKNILRLRILLILAMLLMISVSAQSQTGRAEKMKIKNTGKVISDWKASFPVLPDYRRKFEKAQFENGKLYYQTAHYQSLSNKNDFFEISFYRHPNINPNSRYSKQNDWVKYINVGNYKAYQILPTCGLDFYKYMLEIYPDDSTLILLKAKDYSTTDVIELAKTIDFGQMLEKMKKRRNIY